MVINFYNTEYPSEGRIVIIEGRDQRSGSCLSLLDAYKT